MEGQPTESLHVYAKAACFSYSDNPQARQRPEEHLKVITVCEYKNARLTCRNEATIIAINGKFIERVDRFDLMYLCRLFYWRMSGSGINFCKYLYLIVSLELVESCFQFSC